MHIFTGDINRSLSSPSRCRRCKGQYNGGCHARSRPQLHRSHHTHPYLHVLQQIQYNHHYHLQTTSLSLRIAMMTANTVESMSHLCEIPGNSDRDDGGLYVYDKNDQTTLMTRKKIVMMTRQANTTHNTLVWISLWWLPQGWRWWQWRQQRQRADDNYCDCHQQFLYQILHRWCIFECIIVAFSSFSTLKRLTGSACWHLTDFSASAQSL